jgi:hypothetical protein
MNIDTIIGYVGPLHLSVLAPRSVSLFRMSKSEYVN